MKLTSTAVGLPDHGIVIRVTLSDKLAPLLVAELAWACAWCMFEPMPAGAACVYFKREDANVALLGQFVQEHKEAA